LGYWDANDFNDTKPEVFLKVRPHEVAFNENAKICAFLEFRSPMDLRDSVSEQPNWYTGALDLLQDKDLEKNTRYARHFECIWQASWRKGRTWITT